jgi:hypothetical protein
MRSSKDGLQDERLDPNRLPSGHGSFLVEVSTVTQFIRFIKVSSTFVFFVIEHKDTKGQKTSHACT